MANHAIMKPGVNQTKSQYDALSAANGAKQGFFYMSSDLDAAGNHYYGWGQADGTIAWIVNSDNQAVQAVSDSDTIDMTLTAAGQLSAEAVLSSDTDNLLTNSNGLKVPTLKIAAGSGGQLTYDAATNEIGFTSLAIKNTVVDETATDINNFIANNYTNGDEYQSGDLIYLTAATGGSQVWVNKVDEGQTAAGDATDFIQLQKPDLDDSYIRNLLSAGGDLTYDPSTGEFFLDVSAAPVTDTHNQTGGGAGSASNVQAMFDSIASSNFVGFNIATDNNDIDIDNNNDAFSILGGDLISVTNSGNTITAGIDATGASAGQVISFDGTNVIWEDGQTPLTFENGLTEDAGVVRLGGDILNNTQLNLSPTNYFRLIRADSSNAHELSLNTTGFLFSTRKNDFSSAIFKQMTTVGDTSSYILTSSAGGNSVAAMTINNDSSTGDTYMNIGGGESFFNLDIDLVGKATGKILTVGVGGNNEYTPYSLPTAAGAENQVLTVDANGDIIYGETLNTMKYQAFYDGTLNEFNVTPANSDVMFVGSNLISVDAGAVGSGGSAGAISFKIDTDNATVGQILKAVDDGSGGVTVEWGTDSSNLTADNGINIDGTVIQLGGDLVEDTTIGITAGNEYKLDGATIESVMTNQTLKVRNVNETSTIGVVEEFKFGRYELSAIDPANSDAVDFQLKFDKTFGATFTDNRTDTVGIQYAGAYEADFTDTTLVTKKYVDDSVNTAQSPLTFSNGLTESNELVKLGGTLSENTTLDLGTNSLSFAGSADIESAVDLKFTASTVGAIFTSPDGSEFRMTVNNDGIIQVIPV